MKFQCNAKLCGQTRISRGFGTGQPGGNWVSSPLEDSAQILK